MQERYLAVADLGSENIALTVARIAEKDIQVIYHRNTPSEGIRHSCVFNPRKAEIALRKAIDAAEDELKIKITQLVTGLPRYGVSQDIGTARIDRSEPQDCISQEEIDALKDMAAVSYPIADEEKEQIYGMVAQSFSSDELIQQSEDDILGATGRSLDGNFKVFVGARSAVRNIDMVFGRGLSLACRTVFVPECVGDATLTSDEKENGVALIEMGAEVTSISIYQGGILRFYHAIPFGGKNITEDIKYECSFSTRLAENIKLAWGACLPDKLQSMTDKILQINDNESGRSDKLPVKYLSEIITARAEEIMEAMLFVIQESGFAERLRSGIVITGGGAKLANLTLMIKEMSGYNVRIGYPRSRHFTAEDCPGISDPAAAASVGMLLAGAKDPRLNCTGEVLQPQPEPEPEPEEEPDYTDTVFGRPSEPVQKPSKPSRPKKIRKPKITWTIDDVGQKLGSAVENIFGDLFDEAK